MSSAASPINVFVASTPLQLISCSEARYHYGCSAETTLLVIARPDNRETEGQMAFLAEALGWQGIGSKADFLARQEQDPIVLAMGRPDQRAAVVAPA